MNRPADTDDRPTHIVGIGASAGGLEALRALLERFTADCTAFVVVMHLSPTHSSSLTRILAAATSMTVTTAKDGDILRKNCIYVIPPGVLLALTEEGRLRLSALPKTYPRWTIDLFFDSLSAAGPAAIGIILSGNGTDGTEGLKRIRERGGTTFAQRVSSAKAPEMPASAAKFANCVLAPAALGDALMDLIGATPKTTRPPDARPQG